MTVSHRLSEEREKLLRALEESPGDAELMIRMGRLEFSTGRLDEAERLFRDAVRIAETAEGLEGIGTVLNRQGRYGEALPFLKKAVELDPTRASAWNSSGEALGNLGRPGDALRAFGRAVQARPEFAVAHYNTGLALRAMGRKEEATDSLRRAVRLRPDFPEALHALGGLLHAAGRYAGAMECFRAVIRLRPDDPGAHTSLGAACQMFGDLKSARDCYQKAVELAPRYPDAHSNLGTVYQGLRDMDAAEACFRRALEIAPGHQDALAALAANMDRRGRYQEALSLVENHLDDGNVELVITAAQILRHLDRSEDAEALVEKLLSRNDLTASERQRLQFVRGDVLDQLGRYDEAFEAYEAGNRAKPVRFDREEHRADVDRLLEVFSELDWPDLPRCEDPSERPVFVVGMPRSGTSLVEQILACHSMVAGAGELTELGQAAIELGRDQGLRFPDSMRSASESRLRQAAKHYLERLRVVSADARRVIDKTPANHLFVGFIQNLFPRARVIHCVRHPLDTCLSNYFQNFAGQGIPFSYDLADIALYYNDYLKVMEHWRRHASVDLLEVVYEELVDDQERVSREMVDFLGLAWEPACLSFHRSDRVVATASHAQVRQPLYRSSVGRFANYREKLGPLVDGIDWKAWERSGFAARVAEHLPAAAR
ncbi:MAG: tetratricopeptide repeat protein [Gammaproteobacteria bacterium]